MITNPAARRRSTGSSDEVGDLNAIDRLIRISESRRKLFGLDAPERNETTLTLADAGEDPLEKIQRIREARKAADHGSDRPTLPAATPAGNN